MFKTANQFLQAAGKVTVFNVELVGLLKEIKLDNCLFSVLTDALLKDIKKIDLIFIPAVSGDMKTVLELNKGLLP